MAERSLGITIICILLWIEAIFWIIIGTLLFGYPYYPWYIFYYILLFIGILLVPITFGLWKLKSWALQLTLFLHIVIILIDMTILLPLGIASLWIFGYVGDMSFYISSVWGPLILGEIIPLIILGYLLFIIFKDSRPNFIRNLSWIDGIIWIGFGVWIALQWSQDGYLRWTTMVMWGLIVVFLGTLAILLPSSILRLESWALWLTIILVNIGIIINNMVILGYHYSHHYGFSAYAGYFGYFGWGYEYYLLDEILSIILDGFGNIIPIIIIVYALLSISKVKGEFPL